MLFLQAFKPREPMMEKGQMTLMMIPAKVNSLIEKLSDILMKKGKTLLLNRQCSQVEQLYWCLHIPSRKQCDF